MKGITAWNLVAADNDKALNYVARFQDFKHDIKSCISHFNNILLAGRNHHTTHTGRLAKAFVITGIFNKIRMLNPACFVS